MNETEQRDRPSRRRRTVAGALVGVMGVLLCLCAVAAFGNTFALRLEDASIPHDGGHLDGVLAWPESVDGPVGVVVFVHGDGAVDATSDGFYQPIWESLAEAGYASLSWSKPGVGGSSGDWLDQSLADRATEVEAAMDWVAAQPGIDADRIGLWGASQAGWVVPAVAAERDVAFAILVSPAISWIRQGRYNLLAELDEERATADERARALAVSDDTRRLLDEGADHARYRAETLDLDPMDEARWGFVSRSYLADATSDLSAMGDAQVPTLLLLAEDDLNVDVDETEAVYRDLLGASLEVRRFPDARHTLARTAVEDHTVWGTLVAVLAPREVFAPGYLDAQRDFLR